jgi:hypothetical protein
MERIDINCHKKRSGFYKVDIYLTFFQKVSTADSDSFYRSFHLGIQPFHYVVKRWVPFEQNDIDKWARDQKSKMHKPESSSAWLVQAASQAQPPSRLQSSRTHFAVTKATNCPAPACDTV